MTGSLASSTPDKTLLSTGSDIFSYCKGAPVNPTPSPSCDLEISSPSALNTSSDGSNGSVELPAKKWADFVPYSGSAYRYTDATLVTLGFRCTGPLDASFNFKTGDDKIASLSTQTLSTVTNPGARGVLYNSHADQVSSNTVNSHIQLYVLNKGASCGTKTPAGDILNASTVPLSGTSAMTEWTFTLLGNAFLVSGSFYSVDLCARYYTEANTEDALGQGKVVSVLKYILSYL